MPIGLIASHLLKYDPRHCRDKTYALALIDAMKEHENLVYKSTAKLFYALCIDDEAPKMKAVGKELNAAGGLLLMQCAYYALSMIAQEVVTRHGGPKHPGVYYGSVDVAFHGIGEWQR